MIEMRDRVGKGKGDLGERKRDGKIKGGRVWSGRGGRNG